MSSAASENQMTPAQVLDEEANLFALQLSTASVLPMVLKAAIELDLLEIMAKAGPGAYLSPHEVASHLPTRNPNAPLMLDRIFRLLASYSVLACTIRDLPDGKVERLYGLAPVCKFLVKNEDGVAIAPLHLHCHGRVVVESWYYLKDVILEGGIPFNKAHRMTAFEYAGTDPQFNKIFNRAMSDYSTITMKKLLETYNGFEGLKTVVDVGGGSGTVLSMIVAKYPSIKGVEHVAGDMFISVPKGDAIFMKSICHDWNDEHCAKLLKNCYDALPVNGRVILAEYILPVYPDPSLATKGVINMDCFMLALCPGGKERTEKEFEALAKGAGFQGFRVKCCAFNTHIVEFLKMA
ncbi:hypothetical protein BT93_A2005 [Corymbia citriodora subsp. variegata]|nr:hypothetical protein BT93_A2005 [Corymbia citriodora subsp. variegata]